MKSRYLLTFGLVAVAAAMLASSAGSTPRHDGMLYGCVYVENLGSSSNLDVITWDKHAPHAHGWAMISGGGLNKTDTFQLDQHGWHIDKFNVTSFGQYTFKVGLIRPKLTYTFGFNLSQANDVTGTGCKPH